MKFKSFFISLVLPAVLSVGGCSCKKNTDLSSLLEVDYTQTTKAETFAYIEEVDRENGMNIDNYEFYTTMAIPSSFTNGLSSEESKKFTWPDINSNNFSKIYLW